MFVQENVKIELECQISFVENVMLPLIGQSYLVSSVSLIHLQFTFRLLTWYCVSRVSSYL